MYDTAFIQLQPHDTWLVWLGAGWLLWLPGVFLSRLFHLPRSPDMLLRLALQIGLGLAFWPTLFLCSVTLGWRWSQATARASVLLLGAAGLLTLVALKGWRARRAYLCQHASWLALFGGVAALTILTRLLHVRHLVLPAWVDSVHHTMIVRLLLEQGTLPENYAPFIAGGRFFYHWGYHANVMWLASLLGQTEPLAIAQLILQFGQVLNALTALMLYAAGRALFHSRRAGLLAAVLASLVSRFPAYYVTWGRYTQLTGLLVVPAFGIALWRLYTRPTLGGWLATVVLGAGLWLIHIRVAFFVLTLVVVLAGLLLVRCAWRTLGLWVLSGAAVVLLTLPWLLVLVENEHLQRKLTAPSTSSSDWSANINMIRWDLVWVPHNRELLALATAGLSGLAGWGNMPLQGRIASGAWLLLLIALAIAQWRRRHPGSCETGFDRMLSKLIGNSGLGQTRFNAAPWTALGVLFAWCALTALLLNLDALGLPPIRFMHNSSGIIALFMPLSLGGAGLLAWVMAQLVPRRWAGAIMALLVLGGSTWGAFNMVDILNPVTVLAQPADVRALVWIQSNTLPDACFAVNAWPWMGRTYAGTDGGYWIPVLTDRRSILPPALYTTANTQVQKTNALLDVWTQAEGLDDPALRARLQTAGITHIYIGARGGALTPKQLLDRPFVQLVYQDGPVHIFKWKDD